MPSDITGRVSKCVKSIASSRRYNRYMLNVKNEKRSDYGVITSATTIPNETMEIVNEYLYERSPYLNGI